MNRPPFCKKACVVLLRFISQHLFTQIVTTVQLRKCVRQSSLLLPLQFIIAGTERERRRQTTGTATWAKSRQMLWSPIRAIPGADLWTKRKSVYLPTCSEFATFTQPSIGSVILCMGHEWQLTRIWKSIFSKKVFKTYYLASIFFFILPVHNCLAFCEI